MNPHPWQRVRFDLPDSVPTMISAEEQRYLYWLASSAWSGVGHVVEMGPWLGGSTYCLAAGMRRRQSPPGRLHVYDNFVWHDFMRARAPLPLAAGDSFEPYFRENLREFEELICVHDAWLPDEEAPADPELSPIRSSVPDPSRLVDWHPGQPVEILFVDGAKSWTALLHLLGTFAGALIPGRSLLVFQDYKYWGEYWVATVVEMLADRLELVHNLTDNTVAFELRSPLSARDVEALPRFEAIDSASGLDHLERAALRFERRGDRRGAMIVRLTAVRLLVHKGECERARAVFRDVESRWPVAGNDVHLERAREWLARATGAPLARSLKCRTRRALRDAARLPRRAGARLLRRR